MEDISTGFYIGFVIFAIARLIILIACIILVLKYKSAATYLMLAGIILSVIVSISRQLSHILLDYNNATEIVQTQGIISILDGISEVVLAIGLLLFIVQLLKDRIKIPI